MFYYIYYNVLLYILYNYIIYYLECLDLDLDLILYIEINRFKSNKIELNYHELNLNYKYYKILSIPLSYILP